MNVGVSAESLEIYGASCSRSVLIPSIGMDFGNLIHIEVYSLSQDTRGRAYALSQRI
ncbi:hypothetical protein I79_021322 [Cricetulus griseus]|uniref:Uncharacterized protein n=1 Tax=Cricetulus griseus TaxID=10029 RepID=G3ICC9_CRIGR|nr:hypothetical protein I79_021322 [Cricetulus griseus]